MITEMDPVHSKGTGRSGPKRKTGCLTCRRRKVRCDEAKPTCANCIRLRLDCGYVSPKTKYEQLSSPPSTTSIPTSNSNGKRTYSSVSQAHLSDHGHTSSLSNQKAMPPPISLPYGHQGILWSFDGDAVPAYAPPFQDIFLSSLDSFNMGLDFANSDAFLGPELFTSASGFVNPGNSSQDPSQLATDSAGNEERRKALIEHFVQSTNPVSVILPTHTEWTSACRSLLSMANESLFLLSAICALSALHLYTSEGEDSVNEAFRNYKSSSRSVNAVLDNPHVDDRPLKQAFATIFLLTHVELMAQTTSRAKELDWPLQYLQSAHHRVRQHSERIRLWTGTSKRLLTWMTLLQSKAEYNSGHAALEHSSATLSKSIGDPFARRSSNIGLCDSPSATRNSDYGQDSAVTDDLTPTDPDEDTRPMAEVAYDTINQPAFDFFLKAQAFTSRIISLDRYHRHRGTLETEFETLKDGQQISSDLHALWATRPTTMSFLRDPKGLEEALQPRLARKVLLNLRVYLANFYAQFIYLHRVAFRTYPSTTDVTFAIARIIALAQEILNSAASVQESGSPSTLSDRTSQENRVSSSAAAVRTITTPEASQITQVTDLDTGLPATMLWPLFLAAIECTIPDRQFLLQTMRDMDMRRVSNAARTVFLLEEVLRRQDQEGIRVDHRSVRQDLFEGELSVLY